MIVIVWNFYTEKSRPVALEFGNFCDWNFIICRLSQILKWHYLRSLEHSPDIPGGGGGVLPEKLGRGVRPASQNPYPIYDQNLRFSLPYL